MKLKQRTFILVVITVGCLLGSVSFLSSLPQYQTNVACAAEVTLAWDANLENNLTGYKLYYEKENEIEFYGGTDASEGDSPITIDLLNLVDPDSPSYTISGLEEGTYYYFALTAFDSDGMESDFSDEVGTLTGSDSGGGNGCFISGVVGSRGSRGNDVAVTIIGGFLFFAVLFRMWSFFSTNSMLAFYQGPGK